MSGLKHALFLVGEAEYRSQESMPLFAEKFRAKYGWKVTVCPTDIIEDGAESYEFTGFESTEGVDVIVIFTRFRRLCKRQMKLLLDYIDRGGAVAGFRTSTHSFAFPEGGEYAGWNDGFGEKLFGTPWCYHNGHSSTTDIRVIPEKKAHPILEGVEESFHVRSFLYGVLPLPESCDWLLMGHALESELPASDAFLRRDMPVAWTNTYKGGRVFYTSGGHEDDFGCLSFANLAMNGIRWAGGEI